MSLDRAKQEATSALRGSFAAWQELLSNGHSLQAAIIRGDHEAARAIRATAHDVLDAMLDGHTQVAHHTREVSQIR